MSYIYIYIVKNLLHFKLSPKQYEETGISGRKNNRYTDCTWARRRLTRHSRKMGVFIVDSFAVYRIVRALSSSVSIVLGKLTISSNGLPRVSLSDSKIASFSKTRTHIDTRALLRCRTISDYIFFFFTISTIKIVNTFRSVLKNRFVRYSSRWTYMYDLATIRLAVLYNYVVATGTLNDPWHFSSTNGLWAPKLNAAPGPHKKL